VELCPSGLLERLFNLKHGALASYDTLPEKFLTKPILEGPAAGSRVHDLEFIIRELYSSMGWDAHGVPSQDKLKSLKLPISP